MKLSYGHRYERLDSDSWRIFWTVDRRYAASRLRFPVEFSRDTDHAGLRRFCERWGLEPPRCRRCGGTGQARALPCRFCGGAGKAWPGEGIDS